MQSIARTTLNAGLHHRTQQKITFLLTKILNECRLLNLKIITLFATLRVPIIMKDP